MVSGTIAFISAFPLSSMAETLKMQLFTNERNLALRKNIEILLRRLQS